MDIDEGSDRIVEAIEEGKIVRVSERYARREGLLILRKQEIVQNSDSTGINAESSSAGGIEDSQRKVEEHVREIQRGMSGFEELRRPLDWRKNQIVKELIDNFQWHISKNRRAKGLTRKQLANAIQESENSIKLIENGILSANDFVLINKIQDYLGFNLRKDEKDFSQPARFSVESEKKIKEKLEKIEQGEDIDENEEEEILGSDIEIVEEGD